MQPVNIPILGEESGKSSKLYKIFTNGDRALFGNENRTRAKSIKKAGF